MLQFKLWQLMTLVCAVCVWLGIYAATKYAIILVLPVYGLFAAVLVYFWRSAIPNYRATLKVCVWHTIANSVFTIAIASFAQLVELSLGLEVALLTLKLAILQTVMLTIASFSLMMLLPSYRLATLALVIGMVNIFLMIFFFMLHQGFAHFWGWK